MGDSQSQKGGEASTLIQAGGNVTITLAAPHAEVTRLLAEERERIAQLVWERAQEMLRKAGIQPGPVPMKTLVRVIQDCSLEDDKFLQEQWAALLPHASSGGIPPSFPGILSRLSRVDAVFLSGLFDEVIQHLQEHSGSLNHPTTVLNRISLGD